MNRETLVSADGSRERRVFWAAVAVLGLIAVALLPWWWGVAAAVPIVLIAWWLAYQSGWFHRRTPTRSEAADSSETGGKHAA